MRKLNPSLSLREKPAVGAAIALALGLSACSAPNSYMGIDLAPLSVGAPGDRVPPRIVAIQRYLQDCSDQDTASPACQRALEDVIVARSTTSLSIRELPLDQLAQMASMGSKTAQMELGTRFEEGRGVACDLDKARSLYRRAASTTGGTIWVYQPPVGNGTSGRTVPIDNGPRESGLPAAAERLAALDTRMAEARQGCGE